MSRQLSAKRPATRSSRRSPALRPRLGSDEEMDLAGASGLSLPAPSDSDWDANVFEDSDDDSDYVQRPEDLSSSDEEPEDEVDYVPTHDDSTDSDTPLSERIFERAKKNAPGTDHYSWSDGPNFVRRHAFEGNYHSLSLYSFCVLLLHSVLSKVTSICILICLYFCIV